MSDNNACKGKPLRMEDLLIIEYGLDQNYTLKEIAERIRKDPTTVSREINRNRFLKVNKLKEMDEIISPLILKGQSISHIFTHHS